MSDREKDSRTEIPEPFKALGHKAFPGNAIIQAAAARIYGTGIGWAGTAPRVIAARRDPGSTNLFDEPLPGIAPANNTVPGDVLDRAVAALRAQGDHEAAESLGKTRSNIQAWSDLIGGPGAPPTPESCHEQIGLDMIIAAGELQQASQLFAVAVLAQADIAALWASVEHARHAGLPIPGYSAPMVERLQEMVRAAGLIPEREEEVPHA